MVAALINVPLENLIDIFKTVVQNRLRIENHILNRLFVDKLKSGK